MASILICAILSGILLYLSFSSDKFFFVAYISFVPALLATKKIKNKKQAFILGYIFGLNFFGLLLFWISGLSLYAVPQYMLIIAYIAIILVLSIFPALFFLCKKVFFKKNNLLSCVFSPCIWVCLEWLRERFPLGGFPWGIVAYSQYNNIYFIQIAELVGVFGISYVLLFINELICLLVIMKRKKIILLFSILLVTLFICYLYGFIRVKQIEKNLANKKNLLKIAIIQPNIGLDIPWSKNLNENIILKIITNKLKEIKKEKPDLVIFGETLLLESPIINLPLGKLLCDLEKYTGTPILIGAPHTKIDKKNKKIKNYNCAFFIKDRKISYYAKRHLVPFGEYLPAEGFLPILRRMIPQGGKYSPGEEIKIFTLKDFKFCALICFEGVFSGEVRQRFEKNIDFCIIITDDAWSNTAVSYWQHFTINIFRTIENRAYILRAANTGISALIEPTGKVNKSLGINKEGIICEYINKKTIKSIYTILGDTWLLLFFIFFIIIKICKFLNL